MLQRHNLYKTITKTRNCCSLMHVEVKIYGTTKQRHGAFYSFILKKGFIFPAKSLWKNSGGNGCVPSGCLREFKQAESQGGSCGNS